MSISNKDYLDRGEIGQLSPVLHKLSFGSLLRAFAVLVAAFITATITNVATVIARVGAVAGNVTNLHGKTDGVRTMAESLRAEFNAILKPVLIAEQELAVTIGELPYPGIVLGVESTIESGSAGHVGNKILVLTPPADATEVQVTYDADGLATLVFDGADETTHYVALVAATPESVEASEELDALDAMDTGATPALPVATNATAVVTALDQELGGC